MLSMGKTCGDGGSNDISAMWIGSGCRIAPGLHSIIDSSWNGCAVTNPISLSTDDWIFGYSTSRILHAIAFPYRVMTAILLRLDLR